MSVSRPVLGPSQSLIHCVLGDLSLGVKHLGHEADYSPPFSAKVKNGGAIPPLPNTSSWRGAYLSIWETLPFFTLTYTIHSIPLVGSLIYADFQYRLV
jgi:hypothetical protein